MTLPDVYRKFRQTLQEALNQYQPGWDHRRPGVWREYRHQEWEENRRFSVWVDTLRRWVRGENFPRVRKFEAFLEATDFPPEIREELHRLFHSARQARKRASGELESSEVLTIGHPPLPAGTPFVGREKALDSLAEFMEEGRIISISGPRGVGKTALACQLMARLSATHHRVYLDSLHPDALFHSLAHLLNETDRSRTTAVWYSGQSLNHRLHHLAEALPDVPTIVLADDLEQLLALDTSPPGAELLTPLLNLLTDWSTGHLLVTCQFPPSLPVHLRPLHYTLELDEGLSAASGSQLLRLLDPANNSGLREAPEETLQALVKRARGIPRLLERIAGVLETDLLLTIEDVLSNLLDIDPVRQAVELGYENLNTAQYEILGAVAVFRSAMDIDRLTAIVEQDRDTLRHHVQLLIRLHLLQTDRQSGRLWLHELDREYILSNSDFAQLRVWHQRAARDALQRAIQETSAELLIEAIHHHLAGDNPVAAAEAVDENSVRTVIMQGYGGLFLDHFSHVVNALEKMKDNTLLATAYYHLATVYRTQGQTERALETLHMALRHAGETELRSKIQVNIGHVHRYTESYQAAFDVYEQAAAGAHEPQTQTWALLGIAICRQHAGELFEAEQAADESLRLAMQHRFTFLEGHARQIQADLLHTRGQHYAAIEHLTPAITIAESMTDSRSAAYRHCMLANWYTLLGAENTVRVHLAQADKLAKQAQDLQAICTQELAAARLALWQGEDTVLENAVSTHQTAAQLGLRYIERWALAIIIHARWRAGEDIMLPHLLPRLADMFGSLRHVYGWQHRHNTLAKFYLLSGQLPHAQEAIRQALRFPMPNHQTESLALAAIIAYLQDNLPITRQYTEQALSNLDKQLHQTPNLVLAQGYSLVMGYLKAHLNEDEAPPKFDLDKITYAGLRHDIKAILALL